MARKKKVINRNPVLMYVRCPMCQIKDAVYVKRSRAQDEGLYGRCTKCNFVGYNHNSWLIYLRSQQFLLDVVEPFTKRELQQMLRETIDVY